MRKKQDWMVTGSVVLSLGQKGTITHLQENRINDVDYVYYIYVKPEGYSYPLVYHPSDVQELVIDRIR